MKKLLFLLALTCIFSCEPIDNQLNNTEECITCNIHVYSLSGAIPERISTKVLCTEDEKSMYPEGTSRATACSDCIAKITCK